ncbi:glutamate racemase [Candidatus Margulisiibacteriota bacterium]
MPEISRVKTIVTGKVPQKIHEAQEAPKAKDSSPIGMFDSGVGGLTVLRQVQKQLPHESVIYLADTARVPFGGRSQKEILTINRQIIDHLVGTGVKMVVMACGTSSSIAYHAIKDKYKLPIISLIGPGAKAAASATKNHKIGVIATVGTAGSHAYRRAIKEINSNIEVHETGCPLFVPLIEGGFIRSEETKRVAKEYLSPLMKAGIDTLVLGCTHYPHLSRVIREIVGKDVTLVDPAEETIKEAKQMLLSSGLANREGRPPKYEYFATSNPETFASLGSKLLGKPITGAKQVTLAK